MAVLVCVLGAVEDGDDDGEDAADDDPRAAPLEAHPLNSDVANNGTMSRQAVRRTGLAAGAAGRQGMTGSPSVQRDRSGRLGPVFRVDDRTQDRSTAPLLNASYARDCETISTSDRQLRSRQHSQISCVVV